MNQPTETHTNININTAPDVTAPSQLEACVDELVAVCEQAELHYFPAARATAPRFGRIAASDSAQER